MKSGRNATKLFIILAACFALAAFLSACQSSALTMAARDKEANTLESALEPKTYERAIDLTVFAQEVERVRELLAERDDPHEPNDRVTGFLSAMSLDGGKSPIAKFNIPCSSVLASTVVSGLDDKWKIYVAAVFVGSPDTNEVVWASTVLENVYGFPYPASSVLNSNRREAATNVRRWADKNFDRLQFDTETGVFRLAAESDSGDKE